MINDIPENWRLALTNYVGRDEWESAINKIDNFLQKERVDRRRYYPTGQNIFNAFRKTSFNDVRVVIIGQDPYPNPDYATGLAFSTDGRMTDSLISIYNAIEFDDVEGVRPGSGNLKRWADQGVLLLNHVLTFHKCVGCNTNIHKNKGWEQFTQAVIKTLSKDNTRQLQFMLWGKEAQKFKSHINGRCYHIHAAPHPSPRNNVDNNNAFLNCRHFSAVNNILIARGEDPINWLPPQARND